MPVKPFETTQARAGAGYTATSDLELAQRTESLWTQYAGTRRSVCFPTPGSAPYVQTTTVSTAWQDFLHANGSDSTFYEHPWLLQRSHDRIRASVFVAAQKGLDVPFQLQMRAVSLVESFTKVAGGAVQGQLVAVNTGRARTAIPLEWNVSALLQDWDIYKFECEVPVSTPPSTRRIALDFQGRFNPLSGADPGITTVNREARILSFFARDIPKDQ